MSNRRRTAADDRQHPPGPRTPAVVPNDPPRTQPPEPAESAAPAGASPSTVLAMASLRITRGDPTSEETAAVAAVLIAGLRRLHETGPSAAGPQVLKLPHRTRPAYRAPGSWAS